MMPLGGQVVLEPELKPVMMETEATVRGSK